MMLPLIGTALYLLLNVPPRESGKLTTINEVSLALDWINEDGMMAQCFSSAPEPLYGGFYWVDHTSTVSHSYATRYYYDNGHLIREEWQDNALVSTVVIARHIANYSDISFDFHPHGDRPWNLSELGLPYVVVTIKTTEGEGEVEGTQYIYLRGGETLSRGFAVLASGTTGDPIYISESNLTIDGDVRSYGDISISGSTHTINGTAQAAGEIKITGSGHNISLIDKYAVLPDMSWSLELSDFQPYTFDFGDKAVDLATEDVWEDDTTLKPGVYYTTGTMSLTTHNASGMVTLIGNKVEVRADNTELTPFCNGVLLYGTGTEDAVIEFSGDSGTWYGTLFAPDGGVKMTMTGTNLTLYGAIAAQTFTHTGISEEELRIKF